MAVKYVLEEYYIRYLHDIRKVKETTIRHYQDALNNISRRLIQKGKIKQKIYEILDINELEELRSFLYRDVEFMEQDRKGHNMYSSGLNNYLNFANGQDFGNFKQDVQTLDVAMLVEKSSIRKQKIWERSSIIKKQTIQLAGYLCEIDTSHKTFTAESTKEQYMEGHHAIPIGLQDKFVNSLDVYANVICLCPVCHRLLHYGIREQKVVLLDQIYEERAERLANSGIKISKNDFIELVQ